MLRIRTVHERDGERGRMGLLKRRPGLGKSKIETHLVLCLGGGGGLFRVWFSFFLVFGFFDFFFDFFSLFFCFCWAETKRDWASPTLVGSEEAKGKVDMQMPLG